ncbi:MAG TPA: hypothetical protein VMN57_03950 [Anaerolineales bacterium]|nr:hypothetical protein [Anaerolineales bacterium]
MTRLAEVAALFLFLRLGLTAFGGRAVLAVGKAAVPFSLLRLALTFLKIGSVLYGSGYVLLAFLRSDFVVDPTTALLGLASAVLLFRYRVNSTWLIAGGAAVGLLSTL